MKPPLPLLALALLPPVLLAEKQVTLCSEAEALVFAAAAPGAGTATPLRIVASPSAKKEQCLVVAAGGCAGHGCIVEGPCAGAPAWKTSPAPGGHGQLLQTAQGVCLDLNGGLGRLQAYDCLSGATHPNQHWAVNGSADRKGVVIRSTCTAAWCNVHADAAYVCWQDRASPPAPAPKPGPPEGFFHVPAFLDHFRPVLHVPTHEVVDGRMTPDGMQDPAGNLQLADGTYHVFPCCKWEHFSSRDLVHWSLEGPTVLGGGTGSMAVREDSTVIAMTPQVGVTMYVAADSANCTGPQCLSTWKKVGDVLTSIPEKFARVGDPARPWKARDGKWYQIVGASVAGVAGHGVLYRARDASLTQFDYVKSIIVENRTVGFGRNAGFFDMLECPDFFPLGPAQADGSQKHVFVSSAYLQKGLMYPEDGYHNAVTFWLGSWSPPAADGSGGQLEVETTGAVDWGATTYYSAKSLTGPSPSQNASSRLLGGWVMDANGQSEPRLCKNNDKTPNGAKWVICPEALHREVYLCTNTTTQKHTMCQRPASQLAAMRRGEPVVVKVDSCKAAAGGNSTAHQLLPIQGLQLELHVNLSLCAGEASPQQGTAARGSVGVGVLESADGTERTTIGYDVASRTLFVERGRSSRLPAANPGGGALASGLQGYGVRSREIAPLPEVTAGVAAGAGHLELVVLLDHSILTVFANDAAVITTRIYTEGGNSSSAASFFADGLLGVGVRGSVSAWALSL